jgi:hypothetical protein
MTDREFVEKLMETNPDWVAFAVTNYMRLWVVFTRLFNPVDAIFEDAALEDSFYQNFIKVDEKERGKLYDELSTAWTDADAAFGTLLNDEPERPEIVEEW